MKWTTVVGWAAVLAAIALAFLAWNQRARAAEAREIAAAIQVERDSLRAQLDIVETVAEEAAQAVQEKEDELGEARLEAEVREASLSARVRDLSDEIMAQIPEEALEESVRDTIRAIVADLNAVQEQRLAQQARLLTLSEETIERIRGQVVAEQRINQNLRQQVALITEQRNAFRRAAEPNLWERFQKNAGPIAIAGLVGVGIGLAAGG